MLLVEQFAASGVATLLNPAVATFADAIEAGETVIAIVAMVEGNDDTNVPSDPAFGDYALVRDFQSPTTARRVLIYAAANHPGGADAVTWTKAESGSGGVAAWRLSGTGLYIADSTAINRVDPGTATDGVASEELEIEAGVVLGFVWRDAASGTFNYVAGTGFTDSAGARIWNNTARVEHRSVTGNTVVTFTANDGTLDGLIAGIAIAEDLRVAVPDVVGSAQADATTALESAGFVVAVESAYSDAVPAGDVISQDPAAGALELPGVTVTISVSLGAEPEPEPPATEGRAAVGGYDPYRKPSKADEERDDDRRQIRALIDAALAGDKPLSVATKAVIAAEVAVVADIPAADRAHLMASVAESKAAQRTIERLEAKLAAAERIARIKRDDDELIELLGAHGLLH